MTILANGLDTRYITGVELQDYFVSKTTGQPLAYGQIYFYEDSSRTTAKPVYELTYNSMTGLYSYVSLPNPLTLNATGGFDDGNGNNIPIYYFPYDEFGNLQLYYIVAYDSNNLEQFSRDAWPFPNSSTDGSTSTTTLSLNNMLTNPQFAYVNFTQGGMLTVNYTSAGIITTIAPGWVLNITATNSGTVTVAQNAITGSSAYPYNPPFSLTITPGSFITSLTLTQQLNNNPDWAAPATSDVEGYISGSILLAPNSSIIMNYLKNAGAPSSQVILSQANTTGAYTQFNGTIELAPASNSNNGISGYDTIQLVLSTTVATTFSNVQIVPLTTNATVSTFDQTPVNRQVDQMFNYYFPELKFKPIPSYLVGWDFSVAPFQLLGTSGGPFTIGSANNAVYINETTIVFQTVDNSFGFSQSDSGALFLTAQNHNTQLALIQYIPADTCAAMLNNELCSMIQSSTNLSAGLNGTVSIWACTNESLPSCVASNQTFFTGLNSAGYPTGIASGWTEISRFYKNSAGLGTFKIGTSLGLAPLSGWQDFADIRANINFLAIVVGISTLTETYSWNIQSISLQPGSIPTIPAPEGSVQTLKKCQGFWWQTYAPGVVAGTATATDCITRQTSNVYYYESGFVGQIVAADFDFDFGVTMQSVPTAVKIYSTAGTLGSVTFGAFQGASGLVSPTDKSVATFWLQENLGYSRVNYTAGQTATALYGGTPAAAPVGYIKFHVTADARLGQ